MFSLYKIWLGKKCAFEKMKKKKRHKAKMIIKQQHNCVLR